MTKTTTKYKRAKMRSRARSPKRGGQNKIWNIVIGVIVVAGVALVALSANNHKAAADVSPKIGEHWHAYLGVDVCGTWLPDAPSFENVAGSSTVRAGIHSHGDGLMHTHPYSSSEAGNNAVTGTFLKEGGWSLSDSQMTLWDDTTHKNGDTCTINGKKKKAEVQWATGYPGKKWTGEPMSGNPADYKYHDGEIVAVYFLPAGSKLPKPPGADESLKNIDDVAGATGTTGSTGVTGSTGTTGTTGATGASGASGATTTP